MLNLLGQMDARPQNTTNHYTMKKLIKKFFKVAGIILGSLIALVLLAYSFVYLSMRHRISKEYSVPPENMIIISDSSAIANGAHLANIRGCNDCHGARFEGKVLNDDGAIGRLTTPNLTRGKGGLPANFSVSDWMRVLRHGLNREGKPLLMMPSHETAAFSRKDLNDIIAYAQQLPPVNNQTPSMKPGPVLYVMAYLNKFTLLSAEQIDHNKALEGVQFLPGSIQQGQYLSVTCKGCHKENMKGGEAAVPGMPPYPDLTTTGATGRMNLHQFTNALRTGIKENGVQMDNANMPWKMTSHYTDDEIKALYTYLLSLQ